MLRPINYLLAEALSGDKDVWQDLFVMLLAVSFWQVLVFLLHPSFLQHNVVVFCFFVCGFYFLFIFLFWFVLVCLFCFCWVFLFCFFGFLCSAFFLNVSKCSVSALGGSETCLFFSAKITFQRKPDVERDRLAQDILHRTFDGKCLAPFLRENWEIYSDTTTTFAQRDEVASAWGFTTGKREESCLPHPPYPLTVFFFLFSSDNFYHFILVSAN